MPFVKHTTRTAHTRPGWMAELWEQEGEDADGAGQNEAASRRAETVEEPLRQSFSDRAIIHHPSCASRRSLRS
jgi:hypothetical protein